MVIWVLNLLVLGCPLQAIVGTFGFDERTVKNWLKRAGEHCEKVHQHLVLEGQLDLGQVQADEIKVKVQGGSVWLAMGMMVSSRLWLGGVISPHRDKILITALVSQIRAVALCRPMLLAVDGLKCYVGVFHRAFRTKVPREGQKGRSKLHPWPEIAIVQVVKRRTAGVLDVQRRIVQGTPELVADLIDQSQGKGTINTAFIERLNATFRQRLFPLVRRTRALARQPETIQYAMAFLGCVYNFCSYHRSLAIALDLPNGSTRWLKRTPAIAAGLTDHCWSLPELFEFRVPPPSWVPPKKRGRRSKQLVALIQQWAPEHL